MSKHYSRRTVVTIAARASVAGAVGGLMSACGSQNTGPLCANPDDMNFSETSIRNVNNYTESSPDAAKNCLNCAHFTSETEASGDVAKCGHCAIFEGLANKDGYCDSWSELESA